jgi:hypothetical protein
MSARSSGTLFHAVLLVVVAGLGIAVAVEYSSWLKRASENRALEQQLREMAALSARNGALSNLLAQAAAPRELPPDQLMDLLHLRGEAGVLKQRKSGLDAAREENRHAHVALNQCLITLNKTNLEATADYWPVETCTNAGRASPEAAIQTLAWAAQNCDFTNLLAGFGDKLRKDTEEEIKRTPALEETAHLMDADFDLESIFVLDRQVQDENTVVLTIEADFQDRSSTEKMVMRKSGGEWKVNGPGP